MVLAHFVKLLDQDKELIDRVLLHGRLGGSKLLQLSIPLNLQVTVESSRHIVQGRPHRSKIAV